MQGIHKPMKIMLQAKHSGIKTSLGRSNPPSALSLNLKHIFSACNRPAIRPSVFHLLFISLRLTTARSMSLCTTNSVHYYITTATAPPRIPHCTSHHHCYHYVYYTYTAPLRTTQGNHTRIIAWDEDC